MSPSRLCSGELTAQELRYDRCVVLSVSWKFAQPPACSIQEHMCIIQHLQVGALHCWNDVCTSIFYFCPLIPSTCSFRVTLQHRKFETRSFIDRKLSLQTSTGDVAKVAQFYLDSIFPKVCEQSQCRTPGDHHWGVSGNSEDAFTSQKGYCQSGRGQEDPEMNATDEDSPLAVEEQINMLDDKRRSKQRRALIVSQCQTCLLLMGSPPITFRQNQQLRAFHLALSGQHVDQ